MSNEVDEFLSGLKGEQNGDPFAPQSEDPFENTSATKEVEGETEEDEKPLPFHKDPKVQKFIEKEISKRLSEIKPNEEQRFKEEVVDKEDEITDVLTRIIGNDTPEKLSAIKDFKKVIMEREDRGAEKALQAIQAQQQEEQEVYKEAENEVEQGFENIEETFGVDLDAPQSSKMRNNFIDFVQRISSKDEDGNIVEYPDFTESFQIFQEMNKKTMPSNSRNKELASKSISRGSDASNAPVSGGKSWKDVEKFFNRLN